MLAAYNCVLIIADNTNKRKKEKNRNRKSQSITKRKRLRLIAYRFIASLKNNYANSNYSMSMTAVITLQPFNSVCLDCHF